MFIKTVPIHLLAQFFLYLLDMLSSVVALLDAGKLSLRRGNNLRVVLQASNSEQKATTPQ